MCCLRKVWIAFFELSDHITDYCGVLRVLPDVDHLEGLQNFKICLK